MRKTAAIAIILLMMVPFSALAGDVTTFEGGKTEAVAWLKGPTFTEYIVCV